MANTSASWRVETYGGPTLSFWFAVFALVLLLAASAWCAPGTIAGEPAAAAPQTTAAPDADAPGGE
jgi:hypothetical protein